MALRGLKVVEMAGLAPAPFAGMILADFGASVIRVDRINQSPANVLARNKRSLAVNLKHKAGTDIVKRLCKNADVLLECYRPGVMEKIGLGPDVMFALNKRLIYARLTGFGQSGPLANRAGHDINYLAVSGILSMLGRKNDPPYPPINLLADFAGGSLTCVIGILMALFDRHTSNEGQVVDCSMVDGSAYLGSFLNDSKKLRIWNGPRGENMLDGGAPFYDIYRTSDGKYMSVGSLEPQFYQSLLQGLEIDSESLPHQFDTSEWENVKERFGKIFLSKTRAQWNDIFSKLDACVEPVLEMQEASEHEHNVERELFKSSTLSDYETMPAPKLLRTPAKPGSFKKPEVGEHTIDILREIDYSHQQIADLEQTSVIYQAKTSSKL